MALSMLAPGSRMTSPDQITPIANRGAAGDVRQYQFHLDGQQVTSEMGFVRPSPIRMGVIPHMQYTHACAQPLYGLIVQRKGIRDAFGTLFSADFERTS